MGTLGTQTEASEQAGLSAGRPTVLLWPWGGQGPVCTQALPPPRAPERLRGSICGQEPEAQHCPGPPLHQPSGPALGLPMPGGPVPTCLAPALQTLGTCSAAWELTPGAGAETVAAVPRAISTD